MPLPFMVRRHILPPMVEHRLHSIHMAEDGDRDDDGGSSVGIATRTRTRTKKPTPSIHMAEDGDRDDDGGSSVGIATRTRTRTKKPTPYRVLMLNDDYTPMEFVVLCLQRFFRMDMEQATRVMLHVHQKGVGVCGVFSYEVAETKVAQVVEFARQNQHPLQCTLEKA